MSLGIAVLGVAVYCLVVPQSHTPATHTEYDKIKITMWQLHWILVWIHACVGTLANAKGPPNWHLHTNSGRYVAWSFECMAFSTVSILLLSSPFCRTPGDHLLFFHDCTFFDRTYFHLFPPLLWGLQELLVFYECALIKIIPVHSHVDCNLIKVQIQMYICATASFMWCICWAASLICAIPGEKNPVIILWDACK